MLWTIVITKVFKMVWVQNTHLEHFKPETKLEFFDGFKWYSFKCSMLFWAMQLECCLLIFFPVLDNIEGEGSHIPVITDLHWMDWPNGWSLEVKQWQPITM